VLTPARRSTPELLDDPATALSTVTRSSTDIACCNLLFGGKSALLSELEPLWGSLGRVASLADIGCGVGDLPAAVRQAAMARGIEMLTVAVDRRPVLASRAAARGNTSIAADAFALPFADSSFDIVTACQFLHHFDNDGIAAIARELDRVARRFVVISDLRRNWLAAAGVWLASWPLGLHPVTRHDGFASVLKGFVPGELQATLATAVSREVSITARPAFRVTASWSTIS